MIGPKRGPFAALPEGSEIVLAFDSRGGCAYFWRDAMKVRLGEPPVYKSKRLSVVTIRPPGSKSAPRVAATTCVADGHEAYDTAGALGLDIASPSRLLWTAYPRDHADGEMFKVLSAIAGGWKFPEPLRKLLPVPKPGELITASNDTGGFYSFINDAEEVVAVVLRHVGQELTARVVTLPGGPLLRWQLTTLAREAGFDSQFVRFFRLLGEDAERVAAYLQEVASQGLFTIFRCKLRSGRKR